MALKRTTPLKRRTRLRPQSDKRRSEHGHRSSIREGLNRACELRGWGPCIGPLDPHEIVARGVRPGSHLERELVIGLCRHHHSLITDQPAIGERAGARVPSWAFRQWGATVLDEAARRRARLRNGGQLAAERWSEWTPN